jgi:hypothetical protein
MYGESVEVIGEKKSLVDESKFIPKPSIKDTMFIFCGNEVLVHDNSKKSGWFLGDVRGP